MPIYEYRCDDCHQMFEEWQKKVEEADEPHTCPICKGNAHRVISHTSFALKGQGWYATEYGSKKGASPAPSEGTAAESVAPACSGANCSPAQ